MAEKAQRQAPFDGYAIVPRSQGWLRLCAIDGRRDWQYPLRFERSP